MTMLTVTAKPTDNVIKVNAGDAESLLDAIQQANTRNADSLRSEWLYILIPDGTYNLGNRVLTTLTGHHVALIGQSMTGTIIMNKPDVENEGISKTATLRLMTSDTYLQDLTLKNAMEYYKAKSAGRAVCLQDKGTRTICKRVRMLSHQDTYYSDNEKGQMYFENAEIHGTVDFICGPADVYFNRCAIVTEARNLDGSGRNVIAAPRTVGTPWGYVFESCVVYNRESDFQWARGWKATPRCVWLNTTLMNPERLRTPRFDDDGLRAVPDNFKEFHTMDAEGRDITPESNVVLFKSKEQGELSHETIMKADEAKRYELKKIFPCWRPEKIVEKMEPRVRLLKQQAW
jgi:pectin methylesterase-like acyl-CoA thioesterase